MGTNKELTPLYTESINMLDGLAVDKVNRYLDEHPKIVPLFEVDIAEAITPYVTYRGKELDELDQEAIQELMQAQECLEGEMVVSQRVKASQLKEVNLGNEEGPKPVNVAKEMPRDEKKAMKNYSQVSEMCSLSPTRICEDWTPFITIRSTSTRAQNRWHNVVTV